LPGNPRRAKLIAKMMNEAKLISENREFTVYTGSYDGVSVSVASTGIGGPSTAICFRRTINCWSKSVY